MIHYHGTPFSGDRMNILALKMRHAMISYAAPSALEVAAEVCQSFALDNGAFSAWTRGEPFDVDGFMLWSEKWLKHPACDFALAPDVIDGGEAENDAMLDNCDDRYVPVWHLHESIDRLYRLASTWRRVALGSSGQFATIGTPAWWGRMTEAMDAITDDEGLPITKLHGLRMLDPVVFSHVPFASADSTNVARNIGLDNRWSGSYMPASKQTRALVLMERIEVHAAAHRWNREASGVKQNWELFG